MPPCTSPLYLTPCRILIFFVALALLAAACLGGAAAATPNHVNHATGWTELSSALNSLSTDANGEYPLSGGQYFLSGQVNLTHALNISGAVTLCLNGQVLNQTATGTHVINVTSGSTLTICDCIQTNPHIGYISSKMAEDTWTVGGQTSVAGLWVLCDASCTAHTATDHISIPGGVITGGKNSGIKITNGTVNLQSGTIAGNTVQSGNNGGGVYVTKGTLNISGGSISYNKANHGGGVYVANNGILRLSNGEISNNKAQNNKNGGGVFLSSNSQAFISGGNVSSNRAIDGGGGILSAGKLTITGGNFSYNKAKTGGGLRIAEGSTLTQSNLKVFKNYASSTGGGIYYDLNKDFTLSNGEISNNTASQHGGGIHVAKNTLNLSTNGKISNNTATQQGGGVYITAGATVKLSSNGEISNNTASNDGGGIFVESGMVTMMSGKISNNTAGNNESNSYEGGGVYINIGSMTLSNGEISHNEAGKGGGGIYVSSKSTGMTMTGGTISYNKAHGGGGVTVNKTMSISGGEISYNTVEHKGGGVFVTPLGSLTIPASPTATNITIKNNENSFTECNVYLSIDTTTLKHRTITIQQALHADSRIGVMMENKTENVWGSGIFATSTVAVDETRFTSDAEYPAILKTSNQDGGYDLALGRLCNITWDLAGGTNSDVLPDEAIQGTTITVPEVTKNDGSALYKWSITNTTTNAHIGEVAGSAASITVPDAADATFTAVWVLESFTVTIPSEITIPQSGSIEQSVTVDPATFSLPSGQELHVKVRSPSGWVLTDTEGTGGQNPYSMVAKDLAGAEIATSTAGDMDDIVIMRAKPGTENANSQTTKLTFTLGTLRYSGSFSDTLTFSVSVEDAAGA